MPGQRVEQARRALGADDDRPRRRRDEARGDRIVEEAEELVVEAAAVEDADGLGVEPELLPGDLMMMMMMMMWEEGKGGKKVGKLCYLG